MENSCYHALHYKARIENDIIYVVYTTDLLTIEVAKQVIETRLLLCKGLAYPVLTDIRSIKTDNPAARKLLASERAIELVTAGALLVKNQFHKIIGNIFLLVDKPAVPARVFTDEHEALLWLNRYKKI